MRANNAWLFINIREIIFTLVYGPSAIIMKIKIENIRGWFIMNSLLNILLSAFIGFVYIKIMSFFFKKSVKYMKRKSTDFLVQRLPGWLLIMVSSGFILLNAPPYLSYYYIMQTIMYIAMFFCIVSIFLLLVLKNISITKYNKIVIKIMKEYESK